MKFAAFLVVFVHAALLVSAGNLTSRHSLSKRSTTGKGTWYNGSDLDDAYCYGRNGLPSYTPTDSSMIASINMSGLKYCYLCIALTGGKGTNGKTIILKVVDKCEGCNSNNVDMTTGAFKQLAALSVGVINISWKIVTCPSSGKWPSKP